MQPDIARLHLDDSVHEPTEYVTDALSLPPPPFYSSNQPRAVDITEAFTRASADLVQGQLIKDDFFTLFESVGALEIMDPKMDSGFMMPEKDAAVDNFDPLTPMLPEEILGIMDQMLCYEMAWHDGYPLSQTLFTSLHLNSITPQEYKPLERVVFKARTKREPDLLISDVMRAFCLALLKSCDSVIADVLSEHFYEEEDFVTQTFTQYLLSDIENGAIIEVIDEASETLSTLELSADLKEAFSARLELRKLMLQAMQNLSPAYHAEKTRLWKAVQEVLVKVNATTGLGKPVPAVFSERVQRHLASNAPPRPTIHITWEEAYPKLTKLCADNIEAYRLCTVHEPSPSNIFRFVSDYSARTPQPGTYARSILQGILFKESRFAASIDHIDILVTDIRELVLAGDAILDPRNWEIELPSDPRHQVARKIDEFMSKALDEYLNIPRMLSQNRCRVRRTLNQSLAILDSLQAEAEIIDAEIHAIIDDASAMAAAHTATSTPSPTTTFVSQIEPLQFYALSAWTYNHKLVMAETTIHLGFETEVYLPDEHASMYAFLSWLSETRQEHLSHIDFFALRRAERLSTLSFPASQRAEQESLAHEIALSRSKLSIQLTRAKISKNLSAALSTLYALLATLSLVPFSPSSPTAQQQQPQPQQAKHKYSTPSSRHELRMKPFLTLGTPSPLPSSSALESKTSFRPTRSIASILAGIENSLKMVKADLSLLKPSATGSVYAAVTPESGAFVGCEDSWALEVRGCLASSVAVGVVVAGLRGVCNAVRVRDVKDLDSSAQEAEGVAVGKTKREELKSRIESVDLPVPERRWCKGWVVPRLVVRK
ncbi:hypothetical protein AAFC00_005185 [Neodothiora populina]|uniref:Uncharacterized protein n=1 Tax=Neodothiora populina TaxID=2781224 RepID=A0ABR3PL77_9PEZI